MSKISVDKEDLRKVLTLVEDNMHTSASTSGLRLRGRNLKEMEKELLAMLELTREEAEYEYWEYVRGSFGKS